MHTLTPILIGLLAAYQYKLAQAPQGMSTVYAYAALIGLIAGVAFYALGAEAGAVLFGIYLIGMFWMVTRQTPCMNARNACVSSPRTQLPFFESNFGDLIDAKEYQTRHGFECDDAARAVCTGL